MSDDEKGSDAVMEEAGSPNGGEGAAEHTAAVKTKAGEDEHKDDVRKDGGAEPAKSEEPLVSEERDKGREEEKKSRDRSRELGRDRSRDKSREKSRDRSRDRDRKDRDRDRSRRDRSRERYRERERDRDDRDFRRKSRSRSRDRRRRSRSRDRRRRSRSHSRDRHRNRRSRSHERQRSKRRSSPSDSDSEMGGYKPRRRQDTTKAQPAKPPVQVAGAGPLASNDPFFHLRQTNQTPADPAEAMRLWQEQMLKSRQLVLQQQAKSAAAAASKSQRELYVGNLAAGLVTEAALRQVFDSALMAAFPQAAVPGQQPVVNVNIHSDGRYGFIEFRSPDYATAALQLNGQVMLMGQTLNIGRPASYVDPSKVNVAAQQAEVALAAFKAGVPGGLPGAAAVPGVPGAAVNMAAAANMVAATQFVPGLNPAAAAAVPGLPGLPGLAGLATAVPAVDTSISATPTEQLVVSGMVTAATLTSDEEYQEVFEDLREECNKYGRVVEVKVPRPANPALAAALFGTQNYGKAYVQFADAGGAAAAKEKIHGRMFAGSMVQANFLTSAAYGAVTNAG